MNRFISWRASLLGAAVGCLSAHAATLPADWQREQPFTVATNGLIKVSLPMEALDAARPALEDLRLYTDEGSEVPYRIERPMPAVKIIRQVKSFQVSMQSRATVITIETGLAQPLDLVTLETPARDFLKPVRVEASADGTTWETLEQGQPIFRLPSGASQLDVSFASGLWTRLRLTVSDQRSAPIPFTGARVKATVIEPAPTEWMPATISERNENPGQTRLALNLGAANLSVASVQIETSEPLFTRHLTFAVPQVSEEAIREQTVGQGVIYKIAVEGQPASESLSIPLENLVRSRQLLLFIDNEDSPPLPITGVRFERRPVYLVFLARAPGTFHLLTGNSRCVAPRYDLAALAVNLKSVALTRASVGPPALNPDYRAPEVLAGLETIGAALDAAQWSYRKPVQLAREGAQRLELDPEVLSRAQPALSDLRLLSGGKQIPYLLEHTSISRALKPEVTATTDPRDKALSRWKIKVPQPNLPLTRLQCSAHTALFQRELTLFEELADENGEHHRQMLGSASWTRKPDQSRTEFALALSSPPQTDTLILETQNGDNPPIDLESFQLFYPVTRMVFKAQRANGIYLYYGNTQALAPRYDLSLVADQLLAADQSTASLRPAEQLREPSRTGSHPPVTNSLIFWGVLALVVTGLLFVISKLLPKAEPPR